MSNGVVLWQGPSLIDGARIVVIATGLERSSQNSKTGGMVQTYILRQDISPVEAIRTGSDISICGNCPHRGNRNGTGRTCYVNVGHGPLAAWRAWKRGSYGRPAAVTADLANSENITRIVAIGSHRVVRLGSYGDPAAVPVEIWQALTSQCVAHTGYTHQWRKAPELRTLCMASADSAQDAADAWVVGWRTFRVAFPRDAPQLANEVRCPASSEAGKKLTCDTCRACNGVNGRRGSIVIQAHGGFAVMHNVRRRPEFQQQPKRHSRPPAVVRQVAPARG